MRNSLNRKLITIIGIGWLTFLISGLMIVNVFAAPEIVIFIDRSYCSPDQWQNKVVANYRDFYDKNQEKKVKINSVVLFSDLGEDRLDRIPTPDEIASINTYGQLNPNRQNDLKKKSSSAKILSCQ